VHEKIAEREEKGGRKAEEKSETKGLGYETGENAI